MLELLLIGAWVCLVAYSAWFFSSIQKRERERVEVQERFSGIYNSAKDAIGFADFDGMLLDVNDSFCKLTGYSREELLSGKSYQDMTPKEYREGEAKIIEGILRTGKPAEYEKEFVRKDGSLVPILLTTFVVTGIDGKPMGLAAIIRDVTERKWMEEERNRLFKAVEISKEAISITSADAVMIYTNNAMDELFGCKKGELIGRSVSILGGGPTPEETTKQIVDAIEKNGYWEGETHNKRKDGTEFFSYNIISAAKDEDGKTLHYISTQHDITRRKWMEKMLRESEEKYRSLFENARDVNLTLDLKGKITSINKAAVEYGFKKEDIIGKNQLKFVPKRYWLKLLKELVQIARGKMAEGEIEIITPKGKKIAEYNSNPIIVNKKVVGIQTILKDITERKRLQEKLLKSEKLAAIGQLAAAVGHEIRNPLGVINNSSYFLNRRLKDVADEKVMKHLKIIERKVNSINLIVSDLLDFARKKPPTPKQTDLNDVVLSALSTVAIFENIKVTTKLGEIPPMLLDQEQITRVSQNMILNAVQAMPEGGKLAIETSRHEDSVKIVFKDTGGGIPEENLPKLFTPLFSTKAKGVGLGLTICQQIIESHGGNITVESKVEKGSTFTVELPIRLKEEVGEGPTITVKLPSEMRVNK